MKFRILELSFTCGNLGNIFSVTVLHKGDLTVDHAIIDVDGAESAVHSSPRAMAQSLGAALRSVEVVEEGISWSALEEACRSIITRLGY